MYLLVTFQSAKRMEKEPVWQIQGCWLCVCLISLHFPVNGLDPSDSVQQIIAILCCLLFGDSKESKRIKKICTNVYLMTLRWIIFWFLFVISLFLCSCLAAGCVRAQLMLRRVFNHRAYQLVATEKSVQSVLVRCRHCWGEEWHLYETPCDVVLQWWC